jgi:hypothetical protein
MIKKSSRKMKNKRNLRIFFPIEILNKNLKISKNRNKKMTKLKEILLLKKLKKNRIGLALV